MRHFDVEMNDLQNRLLDMAGLVQKMIQAATNELVSKDSSQIDTVFALEKEVNIQEIVIDDKCLKLIALNQPVGADLRFITSAMRINSDLERMGDESLTIAKMALDLIKYPESNNFVNIPEMIDIVQNMIIDCIKSFNTSDSDLAMSVLSKDNEVDALRDKIISELKSSLIKCPDLITIQQATDMMFIAKSIERLGDHTTNICEDVIFMVHGKDIRHPRA
jgi:phosphate transport system protein